MKIIPTNGFLYVEVLGKGGKTNPMGLIELDQVPEPKDMISLKILAVDTEDKEIPIGKGKIVMTQDMFLREIKPETPVAGASVKAIVRWKDVMAVIEEDEQPQS